MEEIFYILFLAVVAWTVLQMVRRGGMTGMLLGARTQGQLGRVEAQAVGNRRVTLAVHRLEGDRPVGVHFTGRAYMSVERIAGSLSSHDARRLAEALETAAAEQAGS